MIAVDSGMNAAMTATWAEVVYCSAIAIKMGQPKTAPTMVSSSGRINARAGQATRLTDKINAANTPAITARPVAVRNGLNPPTATLVSGTEKEKSSTPRKAQDSPRRWICRGVSVVI